MNKAAFLDRDGVINVDCGYTYKIEDFVYVSGAINGMKQLMERGFVLIVITNQSGIARGLYTEEDYLRLNNWMINDLKNKGVIIQKSYYCPHHCDAAIEKYRIKCECRKPGIELFLRAQNEFDIDMNRSIAIGDNLRDLSICHSTNVRGFLLGGKDIENNEGITVCEDWPSLVDIIANDNVI